MQNTKAEKTEADLLAENGVKIKIGKKNYVIKPLLMGTIKEANKYAVQLKLNSKTSISELLPEYEKNIDPLMKYIAVCILGDKWKIKLFTSILARKLKWELRPADALKLVIAIIQMYDIGTFINSIRFIRETTITTPRETNLIDGKA